MSEEKVYDNSGIFFVNRKKQLEKHPDFTGSIKVNGVDYWLYVRSKNGPKGEFWSVSVSPKDTNYDGATANRTVTTAGTSSLSRVTQPAYNQAPAPEDLGEEIPF